MTLDLSAGCERVGFRINLWTGQMNKTYMWQYLVYSSHSKENKHQMNSYYFALCAMVLEEV